MALLAHWKTNEHVHTGATTAVDSAAGGSGAHNGTYSHAGVPSVLGGLSGGGPYGRHVRGDVLGYGSIGSIAFPADFRILGEVSAACWIRPTYPPNSSGTWSKYLVNCSGTDETSAQNDLWSFEQINGLALRMRWENGSGVDVNVDSGAGTIPLGPVGDWCHVAAVRYAIGGNFGVRFYVNGALVANNNNGGPGFGAPTGGASSVPRVHQLGTTVEQYGHAYASVRVWNSAENDASILAVYNAEKDWWTPLGVQDWSIPEMERGFEGENPYDVLHTGPYSLRDFAGWSDGTKLYAHFGLPNLPPTMFAEFPTAPDWGDNTVDPIFSLGDERGEVVEASIDITATYTGDGPPVVTPIMVDGAWEPTFGGTITPNSYHGFDVAITTHPVWADGAYQIDVHCVDDEGAGCDDFWTFGIVTRPQLLAVRPVARRVVELEFDLPVRVRPVSIVPAEPADPYVPVDWEARGGEARDAANPANYSFARTGALSAAGSAVDLVAIWAEEEPESYADFSGVRYATKIWVHVDYHQTARATYQITVTGIQSDTEGEIIPVDMEFTGFVISQVPRETLILYDQLPGIARRLDREGTGDLEKFFACIQEVFTRLLEDIDVFFNELCAIDLMRPEFLDTALADMGNPFANDFSLTTSEKRKLLSTLTEIYRQKGTCPGIVNAVRIFTGITLDGCTAPDPTLGWILGGGAYPAPDNGTELGNGTYLGGGMTSAAYWSFYLYHPAPGTLTSDQLRKIAIIAGYMAPAGMRYLGLLTTPP